MPPDAVDIGSEHHIRWDSEGQSFLWKHPACRAYRAIVLQPHSGSTGHRLVSGGPDDTMHLTIGGSLLCPSCGTHGFIENGRWRDA